MTNEQIMELLQRDLDDDLPQHEKQMLRVHLQADPSLQLTYDRLKRVCDQLEQLPPVTPRFNLVDAILPQLEATSFQPTSAARVTTKPKLPRLESKKENSSTDIVRSWRNFPLWMAKAGSGLAAACILLGLFFVVSGAKDPAFDPANKQQAANANETSGQSLPVYGPKRPDSTHTTPTDTQPKPETTVKPSSQNKNKQSPIQTKLKQLNQKPGTLTIPTKETGVTTFPFGVKIRPGRDDKPDKNTDQDQKNKEDKEKDDQKDKPKDDDKGKGKGKGKEKDKDKEKKNEDSDSLLNGLLN